MRLVADQSLCREDTEGPTPLEQLDNHASVAAIGMRLGTVAVEAEEGAAANVYIVARDRHDEMVVFVVGSAVDVDDTGGRQSAAWAPLAVKPQR